MPKRTLSVSSLSADSDFSDDMEPDEEAHTHVPKFTRLTASPSPSPSGNGPDTRSPQSPVSKETMIDSKQPIQCLLPPHLPLTFEGVAQFESHLYSHHTNRCADCKANFPTAHLLDLHQNEHHNPLVAARREKGQKTFACLVPGCEKVCENKHKRRMHVVDKHGFRKDYNWAIIERGIDGKTSVLKAPIPLPRRPRKPSLTGGVGERGGKRIAGFQRSDGIRENNTDTSSADPGRETDNIPAVATPVSGSFGDAADTAVDILVKSMSALKFVPRSVVRNNSGNNVQRLQKR